MGIAPNAEAVPPLNTTDRCIYIGEGDLPKPQPINHLTSKQVVTKLIELDTASNAPIVIIIHTPGGHCQDTIAIIEAMKLTRSPLIGVAIGEVCSAGFSIFIHCDIRLMTADTRLMAHRPTCGFSGTPNEIESAREAAEFYDFLSMRWICQHTKLTGELATRYLYRDVWITSKVAMKHGITDGILTVWSDLSLLAGGAATITKRKPLPYKASTAAGALRIARTKGGRRGGREEPSIRRRRNGGSEVSPASVAEGHTT